MKQPETQIPTEQPAAGPWKLALRAFRANRPALISLAGLLLILGACLFLPWFLPHDALEGDLTRALEGPSAEHWFGTDYQGRDLLARILEGGRVSFLVGFAGTAVALLFGTLYGAIAGLANRFWDGVMMRVVDILYAFPFIIIIVILTVYFEPLRHSFVFLFLAIGAVEWMTMARIIRSRTLSLKPLPFVLAARCLGRGSAGILRVHLLPNLTGWILVYGSLTVPRVMLLEAYLSFLGLGIQPPLSSWGRLIKEGTEVMEDFPWMILFPSIIFFISLLCLNLVGEGLRRACDPRETRG